MGSDQQVLKCILLSSIQLFNSPQLLNATIKLWCCQLSSEHEFHQHLDSWSVESLIHYQSLKRNPDSQAHYIKSFDTAFQLK